MAMLILCTCSLVGFVFLGLKLLGYVSWSWFVIASPYVVLVVALLYGVWYYNRE